VIIALQCINTYLMRKMDRMFSLRRSFSAVSILFLAVGISEADGQKASTPPPKTAAEIATAITNSNVRKMPNALIVFESATAHDNFVEVRYTAVDARLFPHNKAEGDERRLMLTWDFCLNPRILLLQANGVVIHQVLAAPDNSDPFEFTIDQSACTAVIQEVNTVTEAHRKRLQSTQSITEPKRVHTLTIRPNQAEEK
jgi:hypothetical protein